jgi:hypothetical protein
MSSKSLITKVHLVLPFLCCTDGGGTSTTAETGAVTDAGSSGEGLAVAIANAGTIATASGR